MSAIGKGFRRITIDEAREIAERKDLRPVRIRGTDIVQFSKKSGGRFEDCTWDDFGMTLGDKKLAIYEHREFMKIMKDRD